MSSSSASITTTNNDRSNSSSSSTNNNPPTKTIKNNFSVSVNLGLGGLGKKRPRPNDDNELLHKAGFDTRGSHSGNIPSSLSSSSTKTETVDGKGTIVSAAGIFTTTIKEPEKTKLIIPLSTPPVSLPDNISTENTNTTATMNQPTVEKSIIIDKQLKEKLFRNITTTAHAATAMGSTPPESQIARLKKLREAINRGNPNDIGNDVAVRPQEHDVTSSSYTTVPVAEFGAAVLRGMGVSEKELKLAMEPPVVENNVSHNGASKKEKVGGIGAASNPLSLLNNNMTGLSSSSSSSLSGIMTGGGGINSNNSMTNPNTHPKPTSKANLLRDQSVMYGRLREREFGRVISIPAVSISSSSSRDPVLTVNSFVMVWQLTGVPGLSKIRIRFYRPTNDANDILDKLRTISETTDKNILNQSLQHIKDLLPISIISIKDVEPTQTTNLSLQEEEQKRNLEFLVRMEENITKWIKLQKDGNKETTVAVSMSMNSFHPSSITTNESVVIDDKTNAQLPTVAVGTSTVTVTQTNTVTASSSSSNPFTSWLIPGIIVRIVDEHFHHGKYFRQKAIVQDVPSPHQANLLVLSNDHSAPSYIDNVPETYLETALPKVGGKIMVVRGAYRNRTGEVLERNSQTQQITLRFYSDSTIKVINYDDVAEYSGSIIN